MTQPLPRQISIRRALAALLVGAVLVPLATTSQGAAESLRDQRERVSQEIDRRSEHLDQSSARLAEATRLRAEAESALQGAQETLARTRGELAAAQAFDAAMQAELTAAVRELRAARVRLAERRADVAAQEDRLAQIAVQSYQSGDPSLLALSMVLNSQDAVQLSGQLNSVRNVLDKESVDLDRLEASRVLLTVQEARFEKARTEVAHRRAAAAENLRTKERLEAEAEQAEAQIQQLVVARKAARRAASRAKALDVAQLAELESERDRISGILRQRAAEARARALAEAQARAAARAQARARAAAEKAARARATARSEARTSRAAEAARESTQSLPAPPASNGLLDPVDGYLTSSYGMRLHPVYERWSLHDGTDFGASCGTPIRAAETGTVVGAYYNSAYGNRVIIDHGYRRGVGLATAYNHLSSFSTYEGQTVERGEVIGFVGNTGYSTGCHLHFMVFENGSTVDPMTWL